jgi:N-acetylglutamate synthase-like GNAT family acetyltransferase
MQIVDLQKEHEELYFKCLEDWSEEIKEAGDHKARWLEKMKEKGLRVKLALDDRGVVGGIIQYAPIEHSNVEGKDLHFIYCIWVHGHKKGRGNFQKRGMGKALLESAEKDAIELHAKGMVAWGISLPFFMRASWFKKRGYRKVDKEGMIVLLWKPFSCDAESPRLIRKKKKPQLQPGKVVVTGLLNGWCPAQNMVYERAHRACTELGDKVVFETIDTFDRTRFQEWGQSDALFVDTKQVRTGDRKSVV